MIQSIFQPRTGSALVLWTLGAILLFVLVFGLLDALPGRSKKLLTVAVTFLAGLFFLLEFLLPPNFGVKSPEPGSQDNFLSNSVVSMSDFLLVIGSMALGLGILNLVSIHGRTLLRGRPGWQNAGIFFVGFIGMTIIGIAHDAQPDSKTWTGLYTFFFNGLYTPLASTVFALLAFYIATAAFRAFRIGSVEATLMMITAFIVMLGNVGSEVVTGWINPNGPMAFLRLDNMTYWIMTTVNMSAQRALIFGIAMGELAIALRIWLSLERGHYFDQEF